jgi:hypothetical protein
VAYSQLLSKYLPEGVKENYENLKIDRGYLF